MKKSILAFLFFCLFLGCGIAKGQEVAVVANKSVKASDVSADELRDIFTGDKTSLKDGTHALPVTLTFADPNAARRLILEALHVHSTSA